MKNTKKYSRIIKAYILVLSLIISSLAITSTSTKTVYGATEIVTSSTISNDTSRNYVNTMINYYLKDSNVAANYNSGKAIVMMFEGASDKAVSNPTSGSRTGALCLVIKKVNGNPKVVFIDKYCSTLPDYPHAYGKFNVKYGDGKLLGPATLKDGIYKIVAINHGSYSGLNVRTFDGKTTAPVVCMKQGGGFFERAALGINVHTRGSYYVTGNQSEPSSAGCLLINMVSRSKSSEYNNFINNVYPSYIGRTKTNYNGGTINYTTNSIGTSVGAIVVDRYLYQSAMYKLYNNVTAVDYITKHSSDAFSKASTLNVSIYIGNTSMYRGNSNNVAGLVSSKQKVTRLTGEIYDERGNKLQSKTIYPNSTFVSIASSSINSSLKFENLAPGKYQVKITAVDVKYGNAPVSVTQNFTVR